MTQKLQALAKARGFESFRLMETVAGGWRWDAVHSGHAYGEYIDPSPLALFEIVDRAKEFLTTFVPPADDANGAPLPRTIGPVLLYCDRNGHPKVQMDGRRYEPEQAIRFLERMIHGFTRDAERAHVAHLAKKSEKKQ